MAAKSHDSRTSAAVRGERSMLPAHRRHPRRGPYPAVPPPKYRDRTIKVAIVYAVCYRFRMPIFRRLAMHPALRTQLLVGKGVPGTKFSNAKDRTGVDVKILRTLQTRVHSTGRRVQFMANPTLPFHLARFRPDVMLVQGGLLPNNWLTLIYKWLSGTPIVWWSLGEVRGREFRGLSKWYRQMTKWVERRSTTFAGYSSATIDYFLEEGYPAERCFNLVNVVDTQLVHEQMVATRDQVPALRTQLELDGRQVVLFVGSITDTKRVDLLIQAFDRVASRHPKATLLIVGDGPEKANVQRKAEQLGIASRVIFTGAVYEGVSRYFQLGDLLVLPGTGGLAVSEGMAHGLPVICSTGDGVEVDLIDDGENGFYIPTGDIDLLVDRMDQALESPELLRRMGKHSEKIIRERANIDRYLNEMLSAIYAALETR